MGGLCSKRSVVDKSPSDGTLNADVVIGHDRISDASLTKLHSESMERKNDELSTISFSDHLIPSFSQNPNGDVDLAVVQLSRCLSQNSSLTNSKPLPNLKTGSTRVSEVSSLLGRAGTVGIGKAVEVLDNLGSSMTSLNHNSGFVSGSTAKGNKIHILAFEVANTIVKGANIMESLTEKSIEYLKESVLPSEGVQYLVSKDIDELLRIAASDKRDELKVFSREVVRFGNRCKDPQWHNLDRYFEKIGSEITSQPLLKKDVEAVMQPLMIMVKHTAELYHELNALDRLDQDYRRKFQEEGSLPAAQKGDGLQILRQELKTQSKVVKGLRKKSLWSRNMEEVMEKLVDVVHFLRLEIHDAFGSAIGGKPGRGSSNNHRKLGLAGLALHYANIITQIDTIVSRSPSVLPNTRDNLYHGLPPSIKTALRSKLQSFQINEEITIVQIKSEMDKTLRWLVPIANNTTKAHHGFGWVGEWANTGTELNQKPVGQLASVKLETLYHADKLKTESCILDLIVWLHQLVCLANGAQRSSMKSPIRSPTKRITITNPETKASSPFCALPRGPGDVAGCEQQETDSWNKQKPGV
ncbi:hypothetical protein HPP92_003133 [Vanilla planifolia]|uniref:Uncharacterized protein n=1 Tax=Vanilla planifolia TaxID=51239 RepID=A0A835VGX8_VANPL|nr:hypothetical protein HPP92_003133 [Vanilla planifolia]